MTKYKNPQILNTCLLGFVISSKKVRKNNIGSSTKHSHNVLFAISDTIQSDNVNVNQSIYTTIFVPEWGTFPMCVEEVQGFEIFALSIYIVSRTAIIIN
jgi:hypothetical protein